MTGQNMRGAEAIRQRYLAVETSNVADVLDELNLLDQGLHASFRPFPADAGKLAGWAHTILGEMRPYATDGGDADKMVACEHVHPDRYPCGGGNRRLLLRVSSSRSE